MWFTRVSRVLHVFTTCVTRGCPWAKLWAVQNFLPRPTPFRFFSASCHVYKSTAARLKLDINANNIVCFTGDNFLTGFGREALCDRAFWLTGHCQRRRGLAENIESRVSRLVYGTVLLRWNESGSIYRLHQRRRWNPGNIEASRSRCDAGPCPWSHRIHQRLISMVGTGMGSVSKSRSGTGGWVSMRACEQRATGGRIGNQQVDTKETSAMCRQVSHPIVIPQI